MTVQDFVDLAKNRRLNLSPAFQRQSVWSSTDRRKLVDSVLDGIPLPSIYLYKQVGRGGKPVYDVIDGKQRLETLLLFMGKGPLAGDEELWVRKSFREGDPIEWWEWRDLTIGQRNEFLGAKIPAIEVEGELGEIIELFVRINATGKRLTSQERRHAYFYASPVLKTAHTMGEKFARYFRSAGVVSSGQQQRMRHVELLTELLLSVNAGAPLNKKKRLDEVIGGKAELDLGEIDAAASDLRRVLKAVRVILPDIKTTRFHQIADFYTLVLLLHRYYEEGLTITAHNSSRNALAGALLRDFGRGVDEVGEKIQRGHSIKASEEIFREYHVTVQQGTDSKPQRERREKLLRTVLDGVFDELDPNRRFNATQRRILWHASTKKRCSICRKEILRWEDVSVDHVTAYIRGGRTDLSNAALAHKSCNSSKGAR